MLECPVLLVVCPTEGIFMIVLEHIVYLYVHWVLCIFYFACLFMFYVFMHISYFRFLFTSLIYLDVFFLSFFFFCYTHLYL